MFKRINNWHLSVLVGIVSIISIAFIQQNVSAQWNDPIGLPGETSGYRLVLNPMTENLLLNDHDLLDDNLRIDGNGSNVIQIYNGGNICFDGTNDCIDSWSAMSGSFWQENTPDIFYNTGNVGIGTDSPGASLEIYATTADGSNLRLQNPTGDMKFIFKEYPDATRPYGDASIRYHSGAGDYDNWLEFWGRRPDSGTYNPIMTMQRDYNSAEGNYLGVGIGVPSGTNINTKLRVQGGSAGEDIFQLYNNSASEVFSMAENGAINIGGGTDHNSYKLSINNGGNEALKLKLGQIWAYNTSFNLKSSGDMTLESGSDLYINLGDNDGVGIEVPEPQQILHVKNGTTNFPDALIRLENNMSGAYSNQTTQVEFVRGPDFNTDYSWFGPSNNATFDLWTMENIPMLFGIGGGERMRLSQEGNLSTLGTIKPGDYNASLTCVSENYGSIVWNETCPINGCLQVCTQVGWLDITTN